MFLYIIKYKKVFSFLFLFIFVFLLGFYSGYSYVKKQWNSDILSRQQEYSKQLETIINKNNQQQSIDKQESLQTTQQLKLITSQSKQLQQRINDLTSKSQYTDCKLDSETYDFINNSLSGTNKK